MSYENAKLVLSGGLQTSVYFQEIYALAGTDQPRIAVDTSPRVTQAHYDAARQSLTTGFEKLRLPPPLWMQESAHDSLSLDRVNASLDEADVLLVTGGATKNCFERWQAAGITGAIIDRVTEGNVVAAGASAGAMIWFGQGYSDSMSYEVEKDEPWDYVMAEGSGLLPSWVTAHHTDTDDFGRHRMWGFRDALVVNKDAWKTAVGIDTGAALVCRDGIATIRDITLPQTPRDTNVYVYSSLAQRPKVLSDGETIHLERF